MTLLKNMEHFQSNSKKSSNHWQVQKKSHLHLHIHHLLLDHNVIHNWGQIVAIIALSSDQAPVPWLFTNSPSLFLMTHRGIYCICLEEQELFFLIKEFIYYTNKNPIDPTVQYSLQPSIWRILEIQITTAQHPSMPHHLKAISVDHTQRPRSCHLLLNS